MCVFFSKYRSYTGTNNNIIHIVHALSATYGKDRLTGERFIQGVIDRGGKKQGSSDRGAIDEGD